MESLLDEYFLPVFLLMWVTICYVLSKMSGWGELAKQYGTNEHLNGERWRFRSALMRATVSYGGCLFFTANRQGLGVSILFPFRIGHPPIFIPWENFIISEEKKYFRLMIKFGIKKSGIPIYVYKSLGDQIKKAGGIV